MSSCGSAGRGGIARAEGSVANGGVGSIDVEVAETADVGAENHGRGVEAGHAPGLVAPQRPHGQRVQAELIVVGNEGAHDVVGAMRLHEHDEGKFAAIDVPDGERGVLGETGIGMVLAVLAAIGEVDVVEGSGCDEAAIGVGVEGFRERLGGQLRVEDTESFGPFGFGFASDAIEIPVGNFGGEIFCSAFDAGARDADADDERLRTWCG